MRPAQHGRLRDRDRRSRSASRDVDKTTTTTTTPRARVAAPKDHDVARDKKTLLDRWVEPSLAPAKPSYQDHGGTAYGVLEHMQPLGELPSAKVKARVKNEAGARKGLKSAAAVGLDAPESTPEGTPGPAESAPTGSWSEPSMLPPVEVDDDMDGDYAPGGKGKGKRAAAGSARSRATRGGAVAVQLNGKPIPTDGARRSPAQNANPNHKYQGTKLKQVVEAAKARALEVGKPDLADAVNEIYEQSLHDGHLTELLEAILTQTATPDQTAEFQKYVRGAKKRLRGAKSHTRNVPAGAANGMLAVPIHTPSASPSRNLAVAAGATEKTETSKTKLSLKVKSPPTDSKKTASGRMSVSPRKRVDSIGSDSSLTSMTSNEDDMEVDDSGDDTADGARPKVNGLRGKDHAAERGSLAAPARGTKRSSAEAELNDERERQHAIAAKKQKLSETLQRDFAYEESHIRQPTSPSTPATRTRAQQAQQAQRALSPDLDSPLSSPHSSRRDSPRGDRAASKPFGRKAKIKQSPEKKSLTGYSGLSGVGGARLGSPTGGDDHNDELSENNDFCSACGGSGFLLCCDGCDRSFHFSCLDPPLNETASELNEPWYCYICVAKRPISSEQLEKPPRGLFASLITNLRKRNPSNFSLPQEIREYFEGTATDKEGNFIEAVHTRTRNRAGYDETPDYVKLKDAKGNTVLCYCCGKSSHGARQIIQCDYCGENWHLDCLDPPLANPPARSIEGKKTHDWMCPLHADQELRKLDTSLLYPRRRIHMRKPRNAKIVETSLKRGFLNNGVIEVVDDASDDSDSEFYEEETQDESIVYRLPASGIKLDFIDKVKNTRVQDLRDMRVFKRTRAATFDPPRQLEQANFARRSFREKQTALNLAQFARANKDLDLGGDQVQNLLGLLIAEAPAEVVEEMMNAEDAADELASSSAIPPSPPASEQTDQLSAAQRKQLQMLQELIRRRLESSKT